MRLPIASSQPSSQVPIPTTPRIIYYHQTHYHAASYVSILPLLTHHTPFTHLILAAIHLNPNGPITLNDDPYTSPKYNPLWAEVRALQAAGIKVLGMLGGAHTGSYSALDGDQSSFAQHYAPLRELIAWTGLDGLDLDVEEATSLASVIRLIDHLKTDFGPGFLVTLAPVATAMQAQQNLSGFDYEVLEKAFGHKVAWYNVQFYCGWGSLEDTGDYDKVMRRWAPERIVVGLVTNPRNCRGWVEDGKLRETLGRLRERWPGFGGVMGWEYFNSVTSEWPEEGTPWRWAELMADILGVSGSASRASTA